VQLERAALPKNIAADETRLQARSNRKCRHLQLNSIYQIGKWDLG
jgi:hypothetical protein